jgi:hypothetical protein
VKRWAGLLLVFVAAAIVALVIAARMRPDDLERRHATIRAGMTWDEVETIMGRPGERVMCPSPTRVWTPPHRLGRPDVELVVQFDHDLRVTETSVRR